jgi:hypothetical protein
MDMSFDDAVAYVRKSKSKAFAFVPKKQGKRELGGSIWLLEYNPEYESKPDYCYEYFVHYESGNFRASEAKAEGELYVPDEIPDAVRGLRFRATNADASAVLGVETQAALAALEKGAL